MTYPLLGPFFNPGHILHLRCSSKVLEILELFKLHKKNGVFLMMIHGYYYIALYGAGHCKVPNKACTRLLHRASRRSRYSCATRCTVTFMTLCPILDTGSDQSTQRKVQCRVIAILAFERLQDVGMAVLDNVGAIVSVAVIVSMYIHGNTRWIFSQN